jgi:benzoate-CoA ligase
MPDLSVVDHSCSPPAVTFPRHYNAAHDIIQRNLQAGRGDKPAFIDDRTVLTYRQLDEATSAFAHVLARHGVKPEQRVLLCLQDTVDFPVCFLGAIKAGVIPVPVNTLMKPSDYEYMLNDSRAPLAVVSAALLPSFEAIRPRTRDLQHLLTAGGQSTAADSLSQCLGSASSDFTVADTTCDDHCFWLYSSGSTGAPKGTVHVHSSLVQTAELYGRPIVGVTTSDVCFSAAKLFFAYGLGNSLSFPMAVGATTILMAERATPTAVFERLVRHQPTVFGGVPTLYAGLLASPDLPDRTTVRLRRCTSAGEPLPAELGRKWQRHFGVDIIDGIGSTEMLHIFLSNRPGDVQYGTTGKPVPGYEVRLVDDDGNPVPTGEQGELQICGPTSATQYWNNREKSQRTFMGRWTRSGDKFICREDGYYIYAGRTDDMLKVSGIYVSPVEVEAALITHAAVLEAAVVGRLDQDGLIKPIAYVVLKDRTAASGELIAELKVHVKTLLAPYKYPRWIEFVPDLPKTATGKIQRYRLRDLQSSVT